MVYIFHWRMIFSENRFPPGIKSGAGPFGIMLCAVGAAAARYRLPVNTLLVFAAGSLVPGTTSHLNVSRNRWPG